jgi:hypothetical protein
MTTIDQQAGSREITAAEASRIDMQAFDRLPESYRDLIRYAQIEIPATVARAYLSAFGQRLGLLLLKWVVAARSRKIDGRHLSARRGPSAGTAAMSIPGSRARARRQ